MGVSSLFSDLLCTQFLVSPNMTSFPTPEDPEFFRQKVALQNDHWLFPPSSSSLSRYLHFCFLSDLPPLYLVNAGLLIRFCLKCYLFWDTLSSIQISAGFSAARSIIATGHEGILHCVHLSAVPSHALLKVGSLYYMWFRIWVIICLLNEWGCWGSLNLWYHDGASNLEQRTPSDFLSHQTVRYLDSQRHCESWFQLSDVNVPDRHMSRFIFSNYSPELSHSVTSLRLVQLGSDFTSFMKDFTSQALRRFSSNRDCGPCLPKMNKCQEFSSPALLFNVIIPSCFLFLLYSSVQGVGGLTRSPPSAHDLVSLLQEHLCYTLFHSTTSTRVCTIFFFNWYWSMVELQCC